MTFSLKNHSCEGRAEIGNEGNAYTYTPLDGTFSLYIYRCPACGSTGKEGSWCEGHSAPVGAYADGLKVRREPVLVPHAEPEHSVTELYDHPEAIS